MKKLKLLWKILKSIGAEKILTGFIGFILIMAGIFTFIEPNIDSYGDALWYCFAVVTTIGFGDLYAVTALGRVLTIILSLYGILIIALIPGVFVSFYMEFLKIKADESMMSFLDKLERLEELSKEELREISEKVKAKKYKI